MYPLLAAGVVVSGNSLITGIITLLSGTRLSVLTDLQLLPNRRPFRNQTQKDVANHLPRLEDFPLYFSHGTVSDHTPLFFRS